MAPVRQNIASGVPMLLCRYEEQLVVTSSITLATAQQVCTSCHPLCDTTRTRRTFLHRTCAQPSAIRQNLS